MALTKTQLTSAITANQITFGVVSTATGFPGVGIFSNPQQPLMVDQEMMFLVQVLSPGLIQVRMRGSDGMQGVPHDISAPVVTSSAPGDFPAIAQGVTVLTPPLSRQTLAYGQAGPITLPQLAGEMVATLNGSGALAMTLAAPSLASNGALLSIQNQSGFAHTVTTAALIAAGTQTAPFSVITFPAFPGANIDLIARDGLWLVDGTQGAITYA